MVHLTFKYTAFTCNLYLFIIIILIGSLSCYLFHMQRSSRNFLKINPLSFLILNFAQGDDRFIPREFIPWLRRFLLSLAFPIQAPLALVVRGGLWDLTRGPRTRPVDSVGSLIFFSPGFLPRQPVLSLRKFLLEIACLCRIITRRLM